MLLLWYGAQAAGGGGGGVTEATTAGNPTGGLLPVTFQAGVVTYVPSPFLQEIKGGLHDIRPIEETP